MTETPETIIVYYTPSPTSTSTPLPSFTPIVNDVSADIYNVFKSLNPIIVASFAFLMICMIILLAYRTIQTIISK